MIIAGSIKNSLVDYPGLISCVLFVPGCNYNCFYCHNRSLIDGNHEKMDMDGIRDFLYKRKGLLDGVVITGGEPTLQDDLLPFIESIRKTGYKIKLDTNGSSPQVVKQLLDAGLCDYYAVDYKAPKARYVEICGRGADANAVHETIALLLDVQVDFEVRTTLFPKLSEQDLLSMSKELPILPRYMLNRYRKPDYYLPQDQSRIEQVAYSQDEITALAEKIRCNQPNVMT